MKRCRFLAALGVSVLALALVAPTAAVGLPSLDSRQEPHRRGVRPPTTRQPDVSGNHVVMQRRVLPATLYDVVDYDLRTGAITVIGPCGRDVQRRRSPLSMAPWIVVADRRRHPGEEHHHRCRATCHERWGGDARETSTSFPGSPVTTSSGRSRTARTGTSRAAISRPCRPASSSQAAPGISCSPRFTANGSRTLTRWALPAGRSRSRRSGADTQDDHEHRAQPELA